MNTNNIIELARMESESFSGETRNRADSAIAEILERFGVESLADASEPELEQFRYMANIGADSELYKLLLIRRKLAQAGIASERHYSF